MQIRTFRSVLVASVVVALSTVAEAQVTIIDLSGAGTAQNQSASAINESGTAVGTITEDGISKAVFWINGTMTRLASVCELCPSLASGINDLGDIVGTVTQEDGTRRGVLWSSGSMTLLAPLPDDTESTATDINNAGDIVGSSGSGTVTTPVRWRAGVPMTLGGPDPALFSSTATAINEAGEIVASIFIPPGFAHQFLWRDGVLTDLDADVPGPTGAATDINDLGVVVGLRLFAGSPRANIWVDGVRSDIAGPWSVAMGINNRGQVVGYSGTGFADVQGTLWEDGVPTILGGQLASDINEVGQAVGSGPVVVDGATYTHALLFQLTPPETPESLLQDLSELVSGIGPGQSLASKVANVIAEFEAASSAATFAATSTSNRTCSALTPLLNEVRAQTGKKLSQAQADAINDLVARLKALLGC